MDIQTPQTSELALQAASGEAPSASEAPAAPSAAASPAAETPTAPPQNEALPTEAAPTEAVHGASPPAKKAAKPPRARRGPPADGAEEPRVDVILATSKMTGADGAALRRGMAVSVPKRRLAALLVAGKVREAGVDEIDRAVARYGAARIG